VTYLQRPLESTARTHALLVERLRDGTGDMDAFKYSHTLLVQRLVGREPLGLSEPFWLELLRFDGGYLTANPAPLLAFLEPYLRQFAINNPLSGNFFRLNTHVAEQLRRAIHSEATAADWQHACNACSLLSAVTAYFLSVTHPQNLISLYVDIRPSESSKDVLGQLVNVCLEHIERPQDTDEAYPLLIAVHSLCITFCSSQLYFTDATTPGVTLRCPS
jgi:hypothetical protein